MKKNKLKTEEEESCPQCVNDVSVGFLFAICKESLSDKIDCKKLSGQYLHGELNADQIAEKILEAAHDNPKVLEYANEVNLFRKTGKT